MDPLPEVVETPRLTLRVWRLEDAAALDAAVEESREHLRPWMPWATAPEGFSTEQFITDRRAQWAAGGDATYGVFADGAVVGGAGLHTRRGPRVLEIGYWIHVARIGRGYASELSRALTDTAFQVPGIDWVEIRHDRANRRSRAIPAKLGFTLIAENPGERLTSGDEGVDCIWSVERERWLGARPGPR
jgi:ribosomal-protein-serine acetyltransferase